MSQTTKTRLDCGNKVESSVRFPNSLADSSNLCPLVIRDGGRSNNVGRWISIVVGISDNWCRVDWSAKIGEGVRGPLCLRVRRPRYCSAYLTYVHVSSQIKRRTKQQTRSRAWLSLSKTSHFHSNLAGLAALFSM